MNTILITGGDIPKYEYVSHLFTGAYVCVADSGLDWVIQNDVEFDMLVGDMDSVMDLKSLSMVPNEKVLKFPKDKDDTDTVIGLKHLLHLKGESTILIGGGGGRIDHLLGIVSIFNTDLAPDVWYTAQEIIYKVDKKFSLANFYKSSVSIYPINKVRCSIESNGLKWDLDCVDWTYKSIGISNSVVSIDGWIDPKDNRILLIIPLLGNSFE
ncbi:MAG: thiamine diphosphokinase [Spirochaetaceae bacterium 4572_7]|nr:MAG: thiamine diphosphokinase [Spirochaetaceae bacterium 4572_7]